MIFNARQYQRDAAKFLLRHPYSALFADPGTGKTAIALLVFAALKRAGRVDRAFIIAPKKVVDNVWPNETRKWGQFNGLTVDKLHGPKKDKVLATSTADLLLVTCDGVKWLETKAGSITPRDMLIVDESTKFKNWSSYRSKAIRKLCKCFSRRHILTGTPVPENYIDLFGQMYIVDRGASLGQTITEFRQDYFYDRSRESNYSIWVPRKGATEQIDALVKPRCYRLSADLMTELPQMVANPIWVDLPSNYKGELDAAPTPAAKHFLERQLASGIMTDGTAIHSAKFEALEDLIESLCGQHMIVFFNFHAEGDELKRRLKAPIVDGRTKTAEATRLLDAWNHKDLPVLLINPAGCSHGLNLQDGGHHACWFSLTDVGDYHEQANKRLHRQGQTETVFIHYLLAKGVCDAGMLDRLKTKSETQKEFLRSMESNG